MSTGTEIRQGDVVVSPPEGAASQAAAMYAASLLADRRAQLAADSPREFQVFENGEAWSVLRLGDELAVCVTWQNDPRNFFSWMSAARKVDVTQPVTIQFDGVDESDDYSFADFMKLVNPSRDQYFQAVIPCADDMSIVWHRTPSEDFELVGLRAGAETAGPEVTNLAAMMVGVATPSVRGARSDIQRSMNHQFPATKQFGGSSRDVLGINQ